MLAIQVENLSKSFPINWNQSKSLRQDLISLLRQGKENENTVKVLDNLSFSIGHGERYAVLGRNGAGKTTLLRLIGNILVPTTGSVRINGSLAVLLGLGAGFNGDLSGWDNLLLGGALLGLKPNEMKDCLDEIIAFSELEDYIHAPMKTYSTGMKARIGFSLILHILPEIILIDETIAVGDKQFQEKCLKRLEEELKGQRTLVFVSHSESFLKRLCNKAILLDKGKLIEEGTLDAILQTYDNLK